MADKIRIISISGSEIWYYSPLHRKQVKATLRKAKGFNKWFLDFFGFGARITLSREILMLEWNMWDDELIRHELAHIDQLDRLGQIVFVLKYFTLMLRYGHQRHPMEIEARRHEQR